MSYKQSTVREIIKTYDINLVGLIDTRIQERKMEIVMNNCLPGLKVVISYGHSESGKILV